MYNSAGVLQELNLCVCSPDVWYRRREPTQSDREAARRFPQPPDGHPGPLAPQQLRWMQHHQAARWRPAVGGGAHHLCQRTLLSAQQVSKERGYLTVTYETLQVLLYPGPSAGTFQTSGSCGLGVAAGFI